MSGSTNRPESRGDGPEGPEGKGGPGPIFICDASAEAERLITGLRNRGYQTVDVPLGMLPSRVRYEVPTLVVCDADAHEALRRVKEMQQEAPDHDIHLLFVGHDDGALKSEAEFKKLATSTLTRPLNLTATLQLIDGIVGPPSRGSSRPARPQRRLRAPVVVASARKPYRSDSNLPSSRPPSEIDEPAWPTTVPPGVGPVLSDGVGEAQSRASLIPGTGSLSTIPPSSPRGALSSETRALLQEGKRRVAAQPAQPHRPTRLRSEPAAEQEVSLELLDALREPLDATDSLPGDERQGERHKTGATEAHLEDDDQGPASPAAAARLSSSAPLEGAYPEPSENDPITFSAASEGPHPDDDQTNPGGRPPSAPPGPPDAALMSPTARPPSLADGTLSRDHPFDPPSSSEAVTGVESPHPIGNSLPAPSGAQSQPTVPPAGRRGSTVIAAPPTLNPSQQPGDLRQPSPSLDDLSDLLAPDSSSRSPSLPLVRNTPAPPAQRPDSPALAQSDGGQSFEESESLRAPALTAVGKAIRERRSGSLAQEAGEGVRRVLLRDGDILTVTSSAEEETLVEFLVQKGDLGREEAGQLAALPRFGRHAGAALIAHGHLRQEDLWPVLRAHAEWILGRLMLSDRKLHFEANVPSRVSEEPAVFGGAAGAEIFIDVLKRTVDAEASYRALGAGRRRISLGTNQALLGEAALDGALEHRAIQATERPLDHVRDTDPDLLVVLLGLTLLGVLSVGGSPGQSAVATEEVGRKSAQMDDEAFAKRIMARRALVDEGDYFTILGVGRGATSYEVDRAWEALRREFSPDKLGPRHVHLHGDLILVRSVIDEARMILRDDTRRTRYRTALEASD